MKGKLKNPKSITIGQLVDSKLSKVGKKEFVKEFSKEFSVEEQTVYVFLRKRDLLSKAKFIADHITDGSLDELYKQLHQIKNKVNF